MSKDLTVQRLTDEFIEANKRFAAAGIEAEASWTEANCGKLAATIVKTGRRRGLSNSVIMTRSREYIQSVINRKLLALRDEAQRTQPQNLSRFELWMCKHYITRLVRQGFIRAHKAWKDGTWKRKTVGPTIDSAKQ